MPHNATLIRATLPQSHSNASRPHHQEYSSEGRQGQEWVTQPRARQKSCRMLRIQHYGLPPARSVGAMSLPLVFRYPDLAHWLLSKCGFESAPSHEGWRFGTTETDFRFLVRGSKS